MVRQSLKNCVYVSAFLLVLAGSRAEASQQGPYKQWMNRFEAAKKSRDYAAGEASILQALRFGNGDEYAWRSLAWCQMRQGKWRESLVSAKANVMRNGACGWSFLQLFESYMLAGDFYSAKDVLVKSVNLRDKQGINFQDCWEQLLNRTCARVFRMKIEPLSTGHKRSEKSRFLLPLKCEYQQTTTPVVEGARSFRFLTADERQIVEIEPIQGQAVTITLDVTVDPTPVTSMILEGVVESPAPEGFLSVFRHGSRKNTYDPTIPEVVEITQSFNTGSITQRAQSLLSWLKTNFRYELGHPDDLKGTLQRKRGQCHHYCGVFAALGRSIGLATRVLHTTSLGDIKLGQSKFLNAPGTGTRAHGQNEVFLGSLGWSRLEPQNPTSLVTYENDNIIFTRTGSKAGEDYKGAESMQGSPMTVTYLQRIPRLGQ